MALVRAALPLAGLLALSLSLAQQSGGLAQQSDYRVKAEFSPVAIDRVLARVDAVNDQWLGEQDFEAIDKKLKQISEQLKTGEGEFPPLSKTISRFRSLGLAEFKVTGSSRARGEADTAILQIRVELGGATVDAGLLSLLGTMRMTWRQAETGWKLTDTELGGFEESSAPRFHFTDVTEAALGHNPSYRKQLALGTDHWRSVIDVAVGVNVYGHHGLSAGDYNGVFRGSLHLPAGRIAKPALSQQRRQYVYRRHRRGGRRCARRHLHVAIRRRGQRRRSRPDPHWTQSAAVIAQRRQGTFHARS